MISTRRLVNILKAFSIWGNITKAIELSTNRFDEETKAVFVSLFEKVSGEVADAQDIIVDGEKVGEVKSSDGEKVELRISLLIVTTLKDLALDL